MEGPSLFLAQEQLKPFKKKTVADVSGNTAKIDVERLRGKEIKDIFAHGKHLVFQFDDFALRFHFLLFGTFQAQVGDEWVTGDYRAGKVPRLVMAFENGRFESYSCSIKLFEDNNLKKSYDYSIDIMSKKWDGEAALKRMREDPSQQIADVLLDQEIFAGVGNIIKNEVLSIVRVNPKATIGGIPLKKLKEIVKETQAFSLQFYRWRKKFELRKHLKTHRKGSCQYCGGKLQREKTGKRVRWSYWCPIDQPL